MFQPKIGRPKSTIRKRTKKRKKRSVKFSETRLGFMLQHEVPVEYSLIKHIMDQCNIHEPSADFIEAIGYSSDDPFFKKSKYWRCLIAYRKYGLKQKMPVLTNMHKELYYIGIRLKKHGKLYLR